MEHKTMNETNLAVRTVTPYVAVPMEYIKALAEVEISGKMVLTVMALLHSVNSKTGACYPSQRELADLVGVSIDNMSRTIRASS